MMVKEQWDKLRTLKVGDMIWVPGLLSDGPDKNRHTRQSWHGHQDKIKAVVAISDYECLVTPMYDATFSAVGKCEGSEAFRRSET